MLRTESFRRLARVAIGLAACGGCLAQAAPAPSVPATDTYHGTVVPDPFRNLEDLKNPQTRAWMEGEGREAAATLSRIEGNAELRQRIEALARVVGDRSHSYQRRGSRLFYLKRPAGANQFKLVVSDAPGAPERVLVDPEALQRATGEPHAINYVLPSWDGKTVAYGVSAGGSEKASLHLMDVASARQLREPISRVQEDYLAWTPDSRYLSFNRNRELPAGAPDTETFLDTTVFLVDRSRPQREPRALFGPLVNRTLGLERLDVARLVFAPGSRWMLARTTDTTVPEGKLFVAPLSALHAATVPWRAVSTAADKITDAGLRGDDIYVRSYAGAPRGRVLAIDARRPELARARVVVPEPEKAVLEGFELGRRWIYTEQASGFNVRVLRHDPARPGLGEDVAPTLAGSTHAVVQPQASGPELWLVTSAWTEPSRLLERADDGALRDTGLRRMPRAEGVPELEVREVLVPSHDGVAVPLAVLHRKGLVLGGRNPTLLDGYGSYGATTRAWFDMRRYAWLERGGVLAYVNPRGSGAFGDPWHRAGFKATKPNTWKDGIAAARWLIAQGYASSATLGVYGGSAGGIFVGRAVTEAPELFAAAIFDVAVMDAVRAEFSANGITNISEFGTVNDPAEFKALLEMSTYHQIRDGVAYPAVLLVHGMNDPRVDAWNSGKAAARLRQANPAGKPVLLRLDAQAGHGIGSTAQQGYAKRADEWSFLLWQFGKVGLRP